MGFNSDSYTRATSVSEQLTSSISSSTGTNFSSNLKTSASGAADSLTGLGSKLFNEGSSLASAGLQSLKQLGSFTTVSKFSDNLKSPLAILQDKPELSRGKKTTPAVNMYFPKDVTRYSISFMFIQYFRDSPLAPKKEVIGVGITLPMPSDLVDRFNAQYASKDLGLVGKVLTDSGVMGDVAQGKIDGVMERFGKGLGKQVTPTNIYAAARSAVGDSGIGAAVDRATGVTVNPYTALQFQGVGLRKHSFKFKLSPNSRDEALELQRIIRAFKEKMLPSKNGLLFTVPDACIIRFNTPNMPYSFKTCFLENLSVNYAPSGIPSFFKGGEFASEVELTLEFGETEPVTRDDITKNGGDITGTGNPYESTSQPTGTVSGAGIPNVFSPTYFGGTSEGE